MPVDIRFDFYLTMQSNRGNGKKYLFFDIWCRIALYYKFFDNS